MKSYEGGPSPNVRFSSHPLPESRLQLSKRCQYGLRAAVRLARRYHGADAYVQSRDLADEESLPTKFLEQVLLVLRRANLLESKVGSGGGYRLRRPPERITVAELLAALEPPAELDLPDPPTLGGRAVRLLVDRLDAAERGLVADWTLADLAEESARGARDAATMWHI